MYDLLLKGGRIYDGSGMPSYNGDVAIKNSRIVEIGRLNGNAKRTLNVDGLAVAPGFIDPHTHLDAQLLWDPLGTSSCFHGVTSVVLGNCGLSLAPAKPENRESMIRALCASKRSAAGSSKKASSGSGLPPPSISAPSERVLGSMPPR